MPGRLTLVHPRWAVPTDEAPATVLDDVVGLTLAAAGQLFVVDWQTVLLYPRGTQATSTPIHARRHCLVGRRQTARAVLIRV